MKQIGLNYQHFMYKSFQINKEIKRENRGLLHSVQYLGKNLNLKEFLKKKLSKFAALLTAFTVFLAKIWLAIFSDKAWMRNWFQDQDKCDLDSRFYCEAVIRPSGSNFILKRIVT